MIFGVTGLLGGGKSYGSVRDMVAHIRRGGVVASNIDLVLPAVAAYLHRPLEWVQARFYLIDPDTNPDCWSWPRGDARGVGLRRVLIVIDEAGEWFSSLDGRDAVKSFAAWLRQSDKRGQDVYLIVQDVSILAKQGRVLVHRWIYMRDMSKWKVPKFGFRLPPPWRYEFHRFETDTQGNKIGHHIHIREKAIFGMYTTGAMFGHSAKASTGVSPYDLIDPNEKPKDYSLKEILLWTSPPIWLLPFLLLAFR